MLSNPNGETTMPLHLAAEPRLVTGGLIARLTSSDPVHDT